MITMRSSDATSFSRLTLRVSGDPVSIVHSQAGVGTALSMPAQRALLDSIPGKSRLFAVRFDGSLRINSSLLKNRRMCMGPLVATRRFLPVVISIKLQCVQQTL